MLPAIADRRSIRRYKEEPVPREAIEAVLQAGILAPSSKNRQPWRFVAATGRAKAEALGMMAAGLDREARRPLLPESSGYLSGARQTLAVVAQAPVAVFVIDALSPDPRSPQTPEERIYSLCNAQSIGACMENMALTATAMGLGSCVPGWAAGRPQLWHWAIPMRTRRPGPGGASAM